MTNHQTPFPPGAWSLELLTIRLMILLDVGYSEESRCKFASKAGFFLNVRKILVDSKTIPTDHWNIPQVPQSTNIEGFHS